MPAIGADLPQFSPRPHAPGVTRAIGAIQGGEIVPLPQGRRRSPVTAPVVMLVA